MQDPASLSVTNDALEEDGARSAVSGTFDTCLVSQMSADMSIAVVFHS